MKNVLLVTLCVMCSAVTAMADLNLKNGSVIRFTDNTTMSTAAGVSAPADHGGTGNTVSGAYSTVGGGQGNEASGDHTTIGGGGGPAFDDGNLALFDLGTVAGGRDNAVGMGGTVSGGHSNIAGTWAVVGGGGSNVINNGNQATGYASVISGGQDNLANGQWAMIPGGVANQASGIRSWAGGTSAKALHDFSFVWGGQEDSRTSAADDTFNIWSTGGIWLNGSVHFTSDRNMKEAFSFVSAREVLDKVVEMPVTSWRFKSEDDSIRHIGPMAQDFMAAFGYGRDDRYITATDADGVALAAIQGLYAMQREELQEQAEVNTALRWHNAQLEARLARLEKALLEEEG